jgi:hypothetical protein
MDASAAYPALDKFATAKTASRLRRDRKFGKKSARHGRGEHAKTGWATSGFAAMVRPGH